MDLSLHLDVSGARPGFDHHVYGYVTNPTPQVTGPVTIIDAEGNEFDIPEGDGIVLCRCGASTTKPFCDKTHSRIGFDAAEKAVREEG